MFFEYLFFILYHIAVYYLGKLCAIMFWDIWHGGDADEELLLKDANKPWWF